jgi:hypothetical protein
MNKMAVFVEGYTEVVFVDRLIEEIASENAVQIQWRRISGGTSCPRTNHQLKAAAPNTGQKHFVVIHDCGGDDAVKSRMMEEYQHLADAGYSRIICIRDVYPRFSHAEIPALEAGLQKYVKSKPIVVDFILSIMELEAWFLAECSHFQRIDPTLTVTAIHSSLRFDPEEEDMQLRPEPAEDLARCYALAGKTYDKYNASQTVEALSFEDVYLKLVEKFPSLGRLVRVIEEFLKQT